MQEYHIADDDALKAFYDPAGKAESVTQLGRTLKTKQAVPMLKVKRLLSPEELARRACFIAGERDDASNDSTIKRASHAAMKRLREEVYRHNEIWESRRVKCDDGKRRRLPQALFITLTYPPEFAGDEQKSKAQLKEFTRRAVRAFAGIGGFWVMEYQRNGRIHFHLLVWRGDALHRIPNRRVSATWADIIAPPDDASQRRARLAATNVTICTGKAAVAEYVSKELSKHLQKDGGRRPGRFWGKFGEANITPHRHEKILMAASGENAEPERTAETASKIHRAGCLQFARRHPRAVQKVLDAQAEYGVADRIGCSGCATGKAAKKCLD